MEHFSHRLRTARLAAGLTQKDVARAAGVTVASVSGWENGFSKSMHMTHLFAVARLLRRNPEWLATGRLSAADAGEQDRAAIAAAGDAECLRPLRRLPPAERRKTLKIFAALAKKIVAAQSLARRRSPSG